MLKPQISVSLARQPRTRKDATTEETTEVDWDKIGKIAQESSEAIGKLVIVTYAAKKLLDTACQIAVIAAQKKL